MDASGAVPHAEKEGRRREGRSEALIGDALDTAIKRKGRHA